MHLVGRCVIYSYRQCSIVRKETSRFFLNVNDANIEEYRVVILEDIDEVLEMMRIEEAPPIDDEIQSIETLVECEKCYWLQRPCTSTQQCP